MRNCVTHAGSHIGWHGFAPASAKGAKRYAKASAAAPEEAFHSAHCRSRAAANALSGLQTLIPLMMNNTLQPDKTDRMPKNSAGTARHAELAGIMQPPRQNRYEGHGQPYERRMPNCHVAQGFKKGRHIASAQWHKLARCRFADSTNEPLGEENRGCKVFAR